ncbi:dihydroorotase [Geminicoccus flavidas]|uniref:dihydroorotase n=1 Tax=Geminicoccus flavidas TaxID=2506407 RepID=UPI00135B4E6C|nr:dihydroorotase [Geminicoccus flavidas]
MSRLLITNARLVDPVAGTETVGALLVEHGRIAAHGPKLGRDASIDAERLDADGLVLAPGLVDLRVQLGEPGAEHKESFASGALAAVAGGVTSFACLPGTQPPIDDPSMVEFVARRARRVRLAKVYPYAAITKGLKGQELAEFGLLREAGAVGFTDGHLAVASARIMRRALSYGRLVDAFLVQHPEEPDLARGGAANPGPIAARLGLASIPREAEVIMIERDLRLARATGGRIHFSRITTAEAVEAIRRAKAEGVRVTCDCTPHHLALNELEVEGYRTFAKVSPPLRAEADRCAIEAAVVDGTIDAIASDHRPQDQDSKRLPFASAEFGVVGLETLLPVALRLVTDGRMSLADLFVRLSSTPARLLGIEGGTLAVGAPADLILLDPDRPWKVAERDLHSASKNTAFEGRLMMGRVETTLVDGRVVFSRGRPIPTRLD